ncbi:hypothetical protein G6L37_04395 [Agrobacterium rubi]|nr:hypothetical protein [Agrobacterium rubi]NTF24592.1 hypothetical protein [Agrobacterium rubi]
MAKFIDPGEEIDLGEFGYSDAMIVLEVHPVTSEWLESNRAPRTQAQALLDSGAWHVHCAESEDGTGLANDFYLHEDDAAHFAVGDKVMYHYKRDQVPGFGQLAFIEREPKSPGHVPG